MPLGLVVKKAPNSLGMTVGSMPLPKSRTDMCISW